MIVVAVAAALAFLIFVNGLYVAAEFATVSSRRTRVSQMASGGNRFARMLLPIVEDSQMLDKYVAACQLGITASSLLLGAFGQNVIASQLVAPLTDLVDNFLPWLESVGVATSATSSALATTIAVTGVLIVLTLLQVIMGELFPKSVAIQYPERLALLTVVPVKWSLVILRPVIWFFNGSGNLVLRLLGIDTGAGHGRIHSPEEIEILVSESHEGGLLDDDERQMLRNAFRLRDLTARQVMAHRTRIVSAPVDTSVKELLEIAIEAGHTRIPLYQETMDNIIGFVHVKDLFRLHVEGNENLAEILREVPYVPASIPVVDVWETLNRQGQYMAIVFDEFGGTAGLITFEDLIEEIFGELQDEFDDEGALMSLDDEGRVHLRGDLLVSDVNEYLQLELPDTADTLSGLVISELGRAPSVGDEINIGETVIRVESMADLGVSEVSMQTTAVDFSHLAGEWSLGSDE
ncbi:MAG TPA: hemolysin family protein [candidate division Zixibacteria bacterium]|nr:hemolysin family protein [candidate division Zixibacteria bacterium]